MKRNNLIKKIFYSIVLIFTFNAGVFAQGITITGVVNDEHGDPVPGVNVIIRGTNVGVITGVDGKYSINAPNDNVVLVFSSVGFTSVERVSNGQRVIDITMSENVQAIEEVVVTALGIKREKKALGYAMSSIKADELVRTGTPINPLTSLYGKAAGVRVASTAGGPGGGMILNVRNSVALNESSTTRPLIVVDGIPIFDENTAMTANDRAGRDRGTGINDINAADIESMDILKGAKAAVLYGSAGANGVVLITTKSGSKKKGFGIEASLSYTWESLAVVPEMQNEFGTGGNVAYTNRSPDLVDANGFLYTMVNGTKTKTYFNGFNGSFGPKMDGSSILWWNDEMLPYSPQPNNYKDFFQIGHLRTANIVMSNSGEMGSFRASYTAKGYDGIQLGSEQQNHSFSFNGEVKISDRVKLSTVSNYFYGFSRNAPYHIQDGFVTYGVRRDMKSELFLNNITDEYGYWYFRGSAIRNKIGYLADISSSYLWNQLQNTNDETKHHFIQSANLNVQITNWLSFDVLAGFDMTRRMLEVKKKVMRPITEDPFQGYYSVGERNILNFYTQYHLNFDYKLNEDFQMTGLFGGVYRNNSDRRVETVTQDFLVENWFSMGNSSRSVKSDGSASRGSDLMYSVLGTAQLSYKNFLYLELTARNDWVSILPPGNNSYFYPGASLSWIVSESLELPDVIKFAKARASIADVGRPGPRYFGNMAFNINSYGGIPFATTGNEIPPVDFANANGKLPKENLKPERKREFEFGVDMYLFTGNRLGFEFSIYKSNSYNEIIALDIPRSSGASKVKMNAGDIQHVGVELQLRGKPFYTRDYQWESILNLSHDKTKIIKLDKNIEIYPLWGVTGAIIEARVGGRYGEIYVNPYKTNDQGIRVTDNTGVYYADRDKKKYAGKITPDVIGGWTNNFSYKNFTLGVNIDFQFGGMIISQTNMYLRGNGTGKESLQYRDEARGGYPYYVNSNGEFKKLDSHTTTTPADSKYGFIFHDGVILPGVKNDGSVNDRLICAQEYYERMFWKGDMAVSEDVIYKSDYIALRQAYLSYEIPDKLSSKLGLHKTQISAFTSNLGYIYKALPNSSPESTMGTNNFTERAASAMVRMLGFELKFTF